VGSKISLGLPAVEYVIASVQADNQVTLLSGPASDLLKAVDSVSASSGPGTGYTNNDPMIFTGGSCSVQPAGFITVVSGSITKTTMTNIGNNCTATPTVTLTTGGGSGQTLTANVGDPLFSANNF